MINNSSQSIKFTYKNNSFYKYILNPLKAGIFGYLIFFLILALTKLVNSFVTEDSVLMLEAEDLLLCLIGFFLAFIMKIFDKVSKNAKE